MSMRFELCPETACAYAQLTFDPQSNCQYILAPYQTMTWWDEHPAGETFTNCPHLGCYFAVRQLLIARQQIWDHGGVEEDLADFWADALALIPEWPGFQRLDLTDAAREYIEDYRADGIEYFKQVMSDKEIRLFHVDRLPGEDSPRLEPDS